jgi:hypothetical protein
MALCLVVPPPGASVLISWASSELFIRLRQAPGSTSRVHMPDYDRSSSALRAYGSARARAVPRSRAVTRPVARAIGI